MITSFRKLLPVCRYKSGPKTASPVDSNIEFLATDISTSALFLAMSARYDSFAISRGLHEDKKLKYFNKDGNVWIFNQELKKHIKFKKFNLQNDFKPLGFFDLVLCRYVTIYFSDAFKREVFSKIALVLKRNDILILGGTETIRGFSNDFKIETYKNTVINKRK